MERTSEATMEAGAVVASILAQREQSLSAMLAMFDGADDGHTAPQGEGHRVPAALLKRVLEGGGLDSYTSGLCIPEASFEGMLRTFLVDPQQPDQGHRRLLTQQHANRRTGDDVEDDLEEVLLDDVPLGNRGGGSLLEAMLCDGGQSQLAHQRGGGDADAPWRCAVRRAVFDNFVDDPLGDDRTPLATSSEQPIDAAGDVPMTHPTANKGDLSEAPAVASATPVRRDEAKQAAMDDDDDDDDNSVLQLLDTTTSCKSAGSPCGGTVVPCEPDGISPSPQPRTDQEPRSKDGPWMLRLREVVDDCDNGIVPFELDPTFDYEANILGTSRRL